MNNIALSDGKKIESESKHVILDSGLSYTLIPSEDFTKFSELIKTNYNISCAAGNKADNISAQVDPSKCDCPDYSSLPSLSFDLLANKEEKSAQKFTMPRETWIKD